VAPEAFEHVLSGRHPETDRPLRRQAGPRSVAGYDLTFCAPKSVSVLHLLAPAELATAVGAGHHAAVAEAADYLGRTSVGVRRAHHGHVAFLSSTGAVAGAFLHRTSRALDPHLHTHLVVANVALGVDGTWSAVDSRRLFSHLGAAQAIYHARLRLELCDRAGVGWDVPPTGLGDVVGVDRRLCRLFSQRSAAMDEFRFVRDGGRHRADRSEGAFHATRPDKDRSVTVDALIGEWRDRAARFGFDLGELVRVVGLPVDGRDRPAIDERRVRDRLHRLATGRSSLTRQDLVAVVATSAPDGATARVIESVATALGRGAGPRGPAAGSGQARWPAHELARVTDRSWSELVGGDAPAPGRRNPVPVPVLAAPVVDRGRRVDRPAPDRARTGHGLER
jgi:conjugative relaxase-like TrwC/TraI family protein